MSSSGTGAPASGGVLSKLRVAPLLFVAVLFGLLIFRQQTTPGRLAGETMGTTWQVLLGQGETGDLEQLARLRQQIVAELARINALMSTYDPTSELSRWNDAPQGGPLAAETRALIQQSQAISEATDGAYDITVGPLLRAHGFGPDGQPQPPDAETLEALRARIGWRKLTLEADGTVRKAHPELTVDLSAIAKGYAVDRILAVLREAGVNNAFVEIGGEIRVAGRRPNGEPWRVGVESAPDAATSRRAGRIIPLTQGAMASSGDYRNYREVDGVRQSHLIDPTTAKPIAHSLAAVSVIADDCATADAWATALMIVGPERAMALASERGLAVLLQRRDGERFLLEASPAWPK